MLPARLTGNIEGREFIFVALLGLFIGSLIGAMAQIIPYSLVLLSAMGVSILAWRQEGSFDLIVVMLGLLIGSLFGNMANVMPYGVTIFFAVVTVAMIWRTQGGGVSTSGPTSTIALILFMIMAVGLLFNGTYIDFCQPYLGTSIGGVSTTFGDVCLNPSAASLTPGYITAYQGCVSDCAITAFTFFGNSPLAFLISGDFIGFLNSFITGAQSGITIGGIFGVVASLITFVVGAILLFLGSGLGIEATAATIGGTISTNEQGTRTFQSLGIGLIMWSFVTGLLFGFGQMFQYIGFGLGGAVASGIGGGAIYVMFLVTYTYELYRQGKTVTA